MSESGGPAGYTAGEWSCVNGGDPAVPGDEITVSLGDDWTCRITNTAEQATLRLVKSVANGTTGGTAVPTDWDMSATGGPTAVGPTAGDTGIVDVAVGSYDLAESAGPDGYTAGDWSCVNGTEAPVTGDQVTVELGDAWVCTITNTADQPTLRLIKSVDNGNTGGTAVPTDWDLSATGGPTAVGPTAGDTGIVDVAIGSYDLAESAGPDGYTAGDWSCVNGTEAPVTGDQVTVELGDAWVCTITNTADQATLQLIKVVDNGTSGQTATAADWNLSATGPTAVPPTAGGTAVLPVSPGAYALAEAPAGTADVSGYVPGAWSCANEGGTPVTGASVTVALGDAWVCTIVNTALYPATVDKTAESAVQDITTGDWTVTYTLDVTNPNPDDPITYDLSDELRFPAAATVNGITVTPPAGVTVNAGFDGDADQVIATGVALPAGATQTYTVVVDVTVTEPLPPPDRECETPGPGTGFDNLGTVTSYGQTDEDEACVDIPELPVPTVSKVVDGAPVQQPDGSWTITYTVAVNNPDAEFAAAYTLSDTLVFGGDITVNSSSVVSVNDPPLSTNPAWTGITPNTAVFVGPRLIGSGRDPQLHGDGERHRWRRLHRGGS